MSRLLLAAVLFVSCGARGEVLTGPSSSATVVPSASPSVTVSTTPSPSPSVRRVAGTLVRLSVNGVEQAPNAAIPGPLIGPLVLRLTFPFDMERPPFERFLPSAVTATWLDDRTVDLLVSQGVGPFKAAELPSRDGASVIDLVFVNVLFRPSRVVSVYTVADLTTTQPPVPDAPATPRAALASRVHLPAQRSMTAVGTALSPDAKTVLVYDSATAPRGSGVQLVDVASDAARPLNAPAPSDGPFVFGGWLSDGRLLIVGTKAWIGNGDGTSMHALADLSMPNGGPDSVAVSPDGRRVAVSYRGRVVVLDLASGTLQPLTESFYPCAQATMSAMTWSLDGKRLAGVHCPPGTFAETAQVTILDIAAGTVLATVGGGAYSLATLSSGELLIVGPSGLSGEGAPFRGTVMTFDGVERQRYLGAFWQLSPDLRYLLQTEPIGGAASDLGTIYTLIDQRTAAKYRLFLPWNTRWLPDGRLAGF